MSEDADAVYLTAGLVGQPASPGSSEGDECSEGGIEKVEGLGVKVKRSSVTSAIVEEMVRINAEVRSLEQEAVLSQQARQRQEEEAQRRDMVTVSDLDKLKLAFLEVEALTIELERQAAQRRGLTLNSSCSASLVWESDENIVEPIKRGRPNKKAGRASKLSMPRSLIALLARPDESVFAESGQQAWSTPNATRAVYWLYSRYLSAWQSGSAMRDFARFVRDSFIGEYGDEALGENALANLMLAATRLAGKLVRFDLFLALFDSSGLAQDMFATLSLVWPGHESEDGTHWIPRAKAEETVRTAAGSRPGRSAKVGLLLVDIKHLSAQFSGHAMVSMDDLLMLMRKGGLLGSSKSGREQ